MARYVKYLAIGFSVPLHKAGLKHMSFLNLSQVLKNTTNKYRVKTFDADFPPFQQTIPNLKLIDYQIYNFLSSRYFHFVPRGGYVCPSHQTLADMFGYCRETICRSLQRLKRLGLIKWKRTWNNSNFYRIPKYLLSGKMMELMAQRFSSFKKALEDNVTLTWIGKIILRLSRTINDIVDKSYYEERHAIKVYSNEQEKNPPPLQKKKFLAEKSSLKTKNLINRCPWREEKDCMIEMPNGILLFSDKSAKISHTLADPSPTLRNPMIKWLKREGSRAIRGADTDSQVRFDNSPKITIKQKHESITNYEIHRKIPLVTEEPPKINQYIDDIKNLSEQERSSEITKISDTWDTDPAILKLRSILGNDAVMKFMGAVIVNKVSLCK